MNILDIVGPIMVGPSSSHTAGAARIGQISRKLLGESVKHAGIFLHGSFLDTGKGHGTDKAIVAGLLGMAVDDIRIPNSFELAKEQGLEFEISGTVLQDAHPNSVKLLLEGWSGRKLEVIGASIGGGRVRICEIDGLAANFNGEAPTLVVYNQDRPGCVVKVTSLLSQNNINIATMQLCRNQRGGLAVMVIEADQEVPEEVICRLEKQDGIEKVTYLCMED